MSKRIQQHKLTIYHDVIFDRESKIYQKYYELHRQTLISYQQLSNVDNLQESDKQNLSTFGNLLNIIDITSNETCNLLYRH